jgi:WXG100 family type VII secretion target
MTSSYGYDGAGQITYHFGEIADVATAVGTFEGTMRGSLEDLFNDFQRLFGAHWKGSAQEACEVARNQWNQGADEIRAALAAVGSAVSASGEQMQQTDQAIAAAMEG